MKSVNLPAWNGYRCLSKSVLMYRFILFFNNQLKFKQLFAILILSWWAFEYGCSPTLSTAHRWFSQWFSVYKSWVCSLAKMSLSLYKWMDQHVLCGLLCKESILVILNDYYHTHFKVKSLFVLYANSGLMQIAYSLVLIWL